MCLRIAGWDNLDVADTDGIALSVYCQGCCHRCKGCHNPELWAFDKGTCYSAEGLADEVMKRNKKGLYDYVVLLGGDFLCQNHADVRKFMSSLVDNGIKIWLYTGYEYDEVPQWCKDLCYCIKTGKYDPQNYPPKKGSKLASSNQRYYFKDGRVTE